MEHFSVHLCALYYHIQSKMEGADMIFFFFSCAQTVTQKDQLNQQQPECINSVRFIKMSSAAAQTITSPGTFIDRM